jgi:tRNA1(Val) A37 N6-methylase TrmN6
VPGAAGLGIERDPDLAALAIDNARANGFDALQFIHGCVEKLKDTAFDHAMANPPYHDGKGTRSPDPSKEAAKRGTGALLAIWATALGRCLRRRGTLTFIVPAAVLPATLDGFAAADCQPHAVLPLWPSAERAAKLVIVQGIKGGRSPMKLLRGLVLHRVGEGFTAEADAILRDAAVLPMG